MDRYPASSFPTYFDSLENDILYQQGDDLIFVDKTTQERRMLEFPGLLFKPSTLKWSADGRFLFFIDYAYGQVNPLDKYDFDLGVRTRVSQIEHIFNYSVNKTGDQFLISSSGNPYTQYHFYDEATNTTVNLDDFNAQLFASDSTRSSGTTYKHNWLNDRQFSYQAYPTYFARDSSIVSELLTVVLSFSNGKLQVENIIDRRSTQFYTSFNKDSSFAFYLDNYKLRVIDRVALDTIAVSDVSSSSAYFSPHQNLIIYNQIIHGGVDIFIGSSVWNMYAFDCATRTSRKLFPQAYDVHSVSLSVSQSQLLCSADYWSSQHYHNIWLMNMDGSNQTLISDTLKHNWNAMFRPNPD